MEQSLMSYSGFRRQLSPAVEAFPLCPASVSKQIGPLGQLLLKQVECWKYLGNLGVLMLVFHFWGF